MDSARVIVNGNVSPFKARNTVTRSGFWGETDERSLSRVQFSKTSKTCMNNNNNNNIGVVLKPGVAHSVLTPEINRNAPMVRK